MSLTSANVPITVKIAYAGPGPEWGGNGTLGLPGGNITWVQRRDGAGGGGTAFLGSGPGRERGPVERGEIFLPFVRPTWLGGLQTSPGGPQTCLGGPQLWL